MSEARSSRLYLAAVVATPVALAMLLAPEGGCGSRAPERHSDLMNMKQMVLTVRYYRGVYETIFATEDGKIDVYRMVGEEFKFAEHDYNLNILSNHGIGIGPSIQDVRAGDYGNFAWERAQATDVLNAKDAVPILWDPEPIGGFRLVGFSDGAVRRIRESEFTGLFP